VGVDFYDAQVQRDRGRVGATGNTSELG
jgi:hypothetical protein